MPKIIISLRRLVKGELLRAWRICSTEEGFKNAATLMKGFFKERGFSVADVEKVHKEVSTMDRSTSWRKVTEFLLSSPSIQDWEN